MIQRLVRYFLVGFLLSPFSLLYAAAETLKFDPEHSYILWKIEHLVFSTQTGKWFVNGTVTLDKEKPENSQVKATITLADIVTGIPELDKHLKGKLFFDVAKYPIATFVSDKVDVLNKATAKVQGILDLHGISKPVTLDVTLNKIGKNPITEKMTAGFTATTTIKRSDFGIKALLPNHLSDEVKIEINVEAYKAIS
jgi:polyisoprenoid-binding protein YceI